MAYTALSMLTKGKKYFDIIIINVQSPDLQSLRLLAQAVELGIISIILSDEPVNPLLARKAMSMGASFYMRKPLPQNIVKEMWQLVVRERFREYREIRVEKNREGTINIRDDEGNCYNILDHHEQGMENILYKDDQRNNHATENNNASKEKCKMMRSKTRQKGTIELVRKKRQYNRDGQKANMKWTEELHAKFLKVAGELGEGNCFPKDILEKMDVPSLTTRQIGSHLQKCRKYDKRASEQNCHHSTPQRSLTDSRPRSSHQRFGSMPLKKILVQHHYNQDQIQTKRGAPPEFPFAPLYSKSIFARGESSTAQHQQHDYRRQVHISGTGCSFNNPFLAQNLRWSQPGSFGMLGPQSPNIYSSNYRAMLGIGENRVQNDFDLNDIPTQETYSGEGEPNMIDLNKNVEASEAADDLNDELASGVQFRGTNFPGKSS